ncbi:hypothetical protein MBANPS3_010932 [Mucor bainieri]
MAKRGQARAITMTEELIAKCLTSPGMKPLVKYADIVKAILKNLHNKDVKKMKEEVFLNANEQAVSFAIKKLPNSFAFLESAFKTDLIALLPRFLWRHGYDNDPNLNESQVNELICLVLTDYYANCNKPASTVTNERTPYIDYVMIPLFKYFSSTTKLMSFLWCEKGVPSHKLLGLCLPDDSTRKLVKMKNMLQEQNAMTKKLGKAAHWLGRPFLLIKMTELPRAKHSCLYLSIPSNINKV